MLRNLDSEQSGTLQLFLEYCSTHREEFSTNGLVLYQRFRCLRNFSMGKIHPTAWSGCIDSKLLDLIAEDYSSCPYSSQDSSEFVEGLRQRGVIMTLMK
jgi:hypothetical protein